MKAATRSLFATILSVGMAPFIVGANNQFGRSGAVFVMTNDPNKNEIIAYERTADGHLFDGSRFETGGRGSGGLTDPLESQGSLTLSQDRSLLFAVNAGSGNVSVFRVRKSLLTLVDKVASGGSQPVAVTQRGNFVFVLNSGGSGTVVGFRLDENGCLRRIRRSHAFLTANGTGGASIAISADRQSLIVTERVANKIDTFHIEPDGTLAPIVVNQSAGPGVFSASVAPGGTLVVSETGVAGAANGSAVSSYLIQPNGMLSVVSESIPTLGAANCWNAITPDGRFVYVSNAGSSSISGFSIAANGVLAPVSGTVAGTNPENSINLDIAITNDGRYLYTLNSGTGRIGIFAIQDNGNLLNLGEAGDLPATAGFNGIAAL